MQPGKEKPKGLPPPPPDHEIQNFLQTHNSPHNLKKTHYYSDLVKIYSNQGRGHNFFGHANLYDQNNLDLWDFLGKNFGSHNEYFHRETGLAKVQDVHSFVTLND